MVSKITKLEVLGAIRRLNQRNKITNRSRRNMIKELLTELEINKDTWGVGCPNGR